jgi:hypothetical protein
MKTDWLPEEIRARWDHEPGMWNIEPDRVEWRDENTGLVCLALRHPGSGHWCGYVGVAPSHPWHGRGYDDVPADIHGGVTFAQGCEPLGKLGEHRVCHTPAPDEPDHLWWLGFDCAHAGDYIPGQSGRYRRDYDTYKTLSFVRGECARLARQAAEALTA